MDELLTACKAYLHIQWDDDDALLKGFISRGMERLNRIAGAELCFSEETLARSLLLDYVRYANSHALEVFERNFGSELLALHMDTQADLLKPEGAGNED